MDIQELILLNSDKVRRDSNLMAFYIESFVKTFGYKPVCTGCSFSSDWRKLVNHVNGKVNLVTLQKSKNTMSTFKLRKVSNVILAYKKDGVTYRKYDNLLNEDFAIAYLTFGTEAEIEQRKKLFAVLPSGLHTDFNDAIKDKSYPITIEQIKNINESLEVLKEFEPINTEELKVKKTRKPRKSKA